LFELGLASSQKKFPRNLFAQSDHRLQTAADFFMSSSILYVFVQATS
jgi:hypothetical protein